MYFTLKKMYTCLNIVYNEILIIINVIKLCRGTPVLFFVCYLFLILFYFSQRLISKTQLKL